MLFLVELFPLLVSLSVLSIVVLWFSIQNYKNAPLLAFIIPLTLAATIISYLSVQSILGYPISKKIEMDSVYVSHMISADDKSIYVWLIEPGAKKPRAVSIPNTENNKKQMSDARDKTENGVKQKMAPHPMEDKMEKKEGGGQTIGGEYMIYDFQISGGSLKDYGNGQLGLPVAPPVVNENQENPGLGYEGEFDNVTPPLSPSVDGSPLEYQDLPNLNTTPPQEYNNNSSFIAVP